MTNEEYTYKFAQIDLACLDAKTGDYSDYRVVLDRCLANADLQAVHQMFEMNSALAFESRERETRDERYARWGIV